jgi:uncharacterized protein (TIGR03083 family)
MDTGRRIDLLEQHGAEIATYAELIPLDTPVPTCPEWDVRALLGHLGMVHRWATEHVRGGTATYPPPNQPQPATAPVDGLTDWYRDGVAGLVAALRAAPDDLDAFTFLADATSAREFWARRQLHETVIHGVDLLAATDRIPAIGNDIAVDGIAELLEGFYARPHGRLKADPPLTLRIAPTDASVSWLVSIEPDRRVISRDGVGVADCTVRAMAADLYLYLWNRWPVAEVEVDGDPAPVELWQRLARVVWS